MVCMWSLCLSVGWIPSVNGQGNQLVFCDGGGIFVRVLFRKQFNVSNS